MNLTHQITKLLTPQLGAKVARPYNVWFCLSHVSAQSASGTLLIEMEGRAKEFRKARLNAGMLLMGVRQPSTYYAFVELAERPATGTRFTWSFKSIEGEGIITDAFEDYTKYSTSPT